jgi:hypothetical protein
MFFFSLFEGEQHGIFLHVKQYFTTKWILFTLSPSLSLSSSLSLSLSRSLSLSLSVLFSLSLLFSLLFSLLLGNKASVSLTLEGFFLCSG